MFDGAKRSADAIAAAKAEAANTSWRWERTPERKDDPGRSLKIAVFYGALSLLNVAVSEDEVLRWIWAANAMFGLVAGVVAVRKLQRQRAAN